MYADADGFFAGCEQFRYEHLRGQPVGIVPMISGSSCVIAASREAKALGVKNVMRIGDARAICPGLIEWPQHPDFYRRAHNETISIANLGAPIDTVKSIDEFCCVLGVDQCANPTVVGDVINGHMANVFKGYISLSYGYAANRLLAKMACKAGKPNGNMVWHPRNLYQHLMAQELSDVPGIGTQLLARLNKAGIDSIERLPDLSPKHMRALWKSVAGERMHYALHGYDIEAEPSKRGMFGHSRMLGPDCRTLPNMKPLTRLLMVKAAYRMRRELFRASKATLALSFYTRDGRKTWHRTFNLPAVADYAGIMRGLGRLWDNAFAEIPRHLAGESAGVCLHDITPMSTRQLDMLEDDEGLRQREEALSDAMDALNERYCNFAVYPGFRNHVPSDNIGMKISYGRVPTIRDRFL
jgi:DNA polymerase-4